MSAIDHYENFPVASWLCPKHLRPAILAIYRFARTADDIADEGHDPAHVRLDDLGQYRQELLNCLQGHPSSQARWSKVFKPLSAMIEKHQLPPQLLLNLLDAFEQDVFYTATGQNYASRSQLLDYCRRSANPIGRLMLHLYGVKDDTSLSQSDAICTGLQLINFWQDRQTDLKRGRNYLPKDSHISAELDFARQCISYGQDLVHRVPGRGGWELRAVVQGGRCVLDKLDALNQRLGGDASQWPRPVITRWDTLRIGWRCLRM
jgi:squalene synthase HpnC